MTDQQLAKRFRDDPVAFCKVMWPNEHLYDKQREVMESVRDNDETHCVGCNMSGKDFAAGKIALWFFLTRTPCRVVTTSVDGTQLEGVLWGEIRNAIQTAAVSMDSTKGGPLLINHLHLRKMLRGNGYVNMTRADKKSAVHGPQVCGISYCIGRVAAKGEGMLGHHVAEIGDGIPRTLFIADEASGVDDVSYERAGTWARRILAIGNAYQPAGGTNFFKKAVEAGDLLAPPSKALSPG